jgi:hypothetical protein
MKALEKSPDRRYLSVSALGADLRRFLNHEPLSVQRQSWNYRTSKFIRRHRVPVAATLLAITALTIGLVVAERQRRIAERRFSDLRHLSQGVFDLDARIQNLAGATDARRALVDISRAWRAMPVAIRISCRS